MENTASILAEVAELGRAEGAFAQPYSREIVLKGILLPLQFLANSTKDTKKVSFATPIFRKSRRPCIRIEIALQSQQN